MYLSSCSWGVFNCCHFEKRLTLNICTRFVLIYDMVIRSAKAKILYLVFASLSYSILTFNCEVTV